MAITERVKKMERKAAPLLVPEFGPLKGMRVLSTGSIIAMPYMAQLTSSWGAEVIHVERPMYGDTYRLLAPFGTVDGIRKSMVWADAAQNRLSLELDVRINKFPEAREILLGLVKQSDFWFENLVWLEQRYGIDDEFIKECFEVNPKLILCHVSGYGKPWAGGDAAINKWWQASYDMIGQSYSGFAYLQGFPGGPPLRANPWTGDYLTATPALAASLAAYIEAQRTGKGQEIDASQFEMAALAEESTFPAYFTTGFIKTRAGNKAGGFQPYDIFECKDGYCAVGTFMKGVYSRAMQAMAEALNDPEFPQKYPFEECSKDPTTVNSPLGKELDQHIRQWCKEHTAREIETQMWKYEVGCSKVYNAKDCAEDPHWINRNLFHEVTDYQNYDEPRKVSPGKVKIYSGVPHFRKTPVKPWRGAPALGQDNEPIYKQLLGYSDEEIKALREKGVI
jgi:crotonobetainyl-CoA:carnitine CoA-transferase CaiB-like acyl-CoA transferase